MLLSLTRPLIFFDLETTGLDTDNDRIVEIGLVKLMPDGERIKMVERMDPGIDIPDGAAAIHGIRTEDVRGLFGKPRLIKFADAILEGDLSIVDNDLAPQLLRHIENCRLKTDRLGSRIVKDHTGSSKKIDAAVCAVMALDAACSIPVPEPAPTPRIY